MTPVQRAKATNRLKDLPSEQLAEALLDLAYNSKEAAAIVEKLATPPEEAVAVFKRKLSGIKRRKRFYHRSNASVFARELESTLEILSKPGIPPGNALKALVSFFQSDSKLMEMADDSYGDMGYVFRNVATKLFAKTAAQINDQPLLIKTFKKLYEKNSYGVRDAIVDHAAEFLTPESLELLREHYRKVIPSDKHDYQSAILTKTLAAQLNDPEQFEAELREHSEHYYHAHIVELAQVFQAAGRHDDLAKRLPEWLTLVQDYQVYKLRDIAVDTYRITGQKDKAQAILTDDFLSHPTIKRLQGLAEFASDSEIEQLKEQIRITILQSKTLHLYHLDYLQESGQHILANEHLLSHHDQINGDHYSNLIPLAKTFASHGFPLAATLIWRELANSILTRAYSKAYPYAADYVNSLHSLASQIDSWQGHPCHKDYLQKTHSVHFRKKAFWNRVPQEIQQLAQS